MSSPGWDMYVFRDGKRMTSGAELTGALVNALCRWRMSSTGNSEECTLLALIAAGELECALLDAGEQQHATLAIEITDALATALLTGEKNSLASALEKAQRIRVHGNYQVAVQEGFAYYALHPRKVAMLVEELPLAPRVGVVGIRSIGVVLSAVACAALRGRGIRCERMTVRPTGHPYNRELEQTQELRNFAERSKAGEILIVDEGPGISGSSFLAVAEAVEACGIAAERVQMIGSRAIDVCSLRATNATARWSRYGFHSMQPAPLVPAEASESLSGGSWRRHFHNQAEPVPATWTALEPAKFLSRDGQSLYKFEGLGHYGEELGARALMLAGHGFSPSYLSSRRGFGCYRMIRGRALTWRDLARGALERVAEYVAWRGAAMPSTQPQSAELEKMLRWNWQAEFGDELSAEEGRLPVHRPTVCDGRLMPHEWLRSENGRMLKLDAVAHGDNHFFPGPCDIAWDVAGTIVEWRLPWQAREAFLDGYERRSGDRVRQRLHPYLLAYTVFQLGWCKMAAAAMPGEFDESLLLRDYASYRSVAVELRRRQNAA